MDQIKVMKEKRWEIHDKATNLMKAHPGEHFTEKVLKDFNDLMDEVTRLDKELDRLEDAERAVINKLNRVSGVPGYIPANRESANSGSGNSFVLADICRSLKHGHAAMNVPENIKALTSTTGSATISDPNVQDQILFALQANNELVDAGVTFTQIDNYQSVPKVTTFHFVGWQTAESAELTIDSALTIGSVKWTLHDLYCRIRVSNQLLADSSDRARRLIDQSITKALQDELGRVVLLGSNTGGEPAGIEQFSGLQDTPSGGALGDYQHIITSVKKLLSVNVPLTNISMFGSPEVWRQMASFEAAGDGQSLMIPDLLKPVRFMSPTSWIPENYDTDKTKAFLGDFSKIIVGVQGAFNFVLDQTRASHLESEFIAWMRCDVQATHENAFCTISGITVTP